MVSLTCRMRHVIREATLWKGDIHATESGLVVALTKSARPCCTSLLSNLYWSSMSSWIALAVASWPCRDNVEVNAPLTALSAQAGPVSATHWLGIPKSEYGRKKAAGIISRLINVFSFALLLTRLWPLSLMLPAVLWVAIPSASVPILIVVSTSVSHYS